MFYFRINRQTMFYYHRHKHKQKYKGAMIMLLIQIVGIFGIFYFFMKNYNKFTVQDGMAENFQPTKIVFDVQTGSIDTNDKDGNMEYEGIFGSIFRGRQQKSSSNFQMENKELKKVDINLKLVRIFIFYKNLYDRGLVDAYMLDYILQHQNNVENIRQNLQLLLDYKDISSINMSVAKIDNEIQSQEKLIKNGDLKGLITIYKAYETFLQNTKNNKKQSLTANLASFPEFLYLLDKVSTDEKNMYKDDIKLVSKIFDINPNLIKSAIMTEQLRGFFSYRGLMKSIVASQKYIMIMKNSSRGIGGVKEKTAIKAENFIISSYPNIWKKYMEYQTNSNVTNERFARLTSEHNYFYQILYIGAILKMNIDERKSAGIDISQNPGALLTLYNIGNRKPHPNPEIGGAPLNIAGENFSFGKLAMFIYYFLEIYE